VVNGKLKVATHTAACPKSTVPSCSLRSHHWFQNSQYVLKSYPCHSYSSHRLGATSEHTKQPLQVCVIIRHGNPPSNWTGVGQDKDPLVPPLNESVYCKVVQKKLSQTSCLRVAGHHHLHFSLLGWDLCWDLWGLGSDD